MKLLKLLTYQYTQKHRHYHTLEHIAHMFEIARKHDVELSETQCIAIWWHDAVYDPSSHTNEEDSIDMLGYAIDILKYDYNEIARIIFDTKTHQPRSEQSAIVCDLDMMILAASPEEYFEYTKKIRKEFSNYTNEQYLEGRLKFLKTLKDTKIFHSPVFEKYENIAQRNINNEIGTIEYAQFLDLV